MHTDKKQPQVETGTNAHRCLRELGARPRLITVGGLALTAAALLLCFACSAALAVSAGHQFAGTLGAASSANPDPYPLAEPSDVVVSRTTGSVYVNDPGNFRVEKFDSSGHFLLMFGGNVNKTALENGRPSEADVCPAPGHAADVCQSGSSGLAPGEFTNPLYLAIDDSNGPSAGDVYVGNFAAGEGSAAGSVQKFDSNGRIVSSWGESGQKHGHDKGFEAFSGMTGIATGPQGELWVHIGGNQALLEYAQNGNFMQHWYANGAFSMKVDSAGFVYTARGETGSGAQVFKETLQPNEFLSRGVPFTSAFPTTGFSFDRSDESLYQDLGQEAGGGSPHGPEIAHYSSECDPSQGACTPIELFGTGHLFNAKGLGVAASDHTVYVANKGTSDVAIFTDIRPTVTTSGPTAVGETGATLNGTINPISNGVDHGPIVECRFEWGLTSAYGHTIPCQPDPETGSPFTSATPVSGELSGLTPITELPPGTKYHYRLVASNEAGATGEGHDEILRTTAAPQIEGISTSHLAANSAQIDASIKPNGLETSYFVEYGPSIAYGEVTPLLTIAGNDEELATAHEVHIALEGLLRGTTYHFRIVASNALGERPSEDQTFNFFPPQCPNSEVRQQTGAAYLPDCRAYELVSPSNANATLFYPGGPNTGLATSPSRLSFTGSFSAVPGTNPINTAGDLYVSTRTPNGWQTKYIGLSGSQAGCMGGPPTDPRSMQAGQIEQLQSVVLTDPSMSRFLDFNDGSPNACNGGTGIFLENGFQAESPSNAPYLWNANGTLAMRLPTGLAEDELRDFDCPYAEIHSIAGICSGETTASGDLAHLVFSSKAASFSGPGEPAGLTTPPGSVYDQNLATGKISLVSLLPASLGEGNILQDPSFANVPPAKGEGAGFQGISTTGGPEEYIRIPAVSDDGSHILMSTAAGPQPFPECSIDAELVPCKRYIEAPVHLYMRVNDAASYEIAEDSATNEPAAVRYVGMTPDGDKVFFTSEEHLTHENEEHTGASLYMWSAAKAENNEEPLTLISKGESSTPGAPGNTAGCHTGLAKIEGNLTTGVKAAPWTTGCGVVPYSGYAISWRPGGGGGSGMEGRIGGSAYAPAGISANGDIYFISPEQLVGSHGVPDEENLYLYRNEHLQYVTTLTPERRCGTKILNRSVCSDGPIARMQVTPDGAHMAFLTGSRITSYDNAHHLELYTYAPATGNLVCVSCNPSGQSPTGDVAVSQNGLFLTNDGRAFFSTNESLTRQDTNEGEDVYEYVDGRAQLITTGTGTAELAELNGFGLEAHLGQAPGLVGVSANGTDVYISTFDTLIPEDHNGNFLRFYDVRTGGGFPQPPPQLPCAAAEECHGPGTERPTLPTQGSSSQISNGNLAQRASKKSKAAKHKSKRRHRHRKHAHRSGGRR